MFEIYGNNFKCMYFFNIKCLEMKLAFHLY